MGEGLMNDNNLKGHGFHEITAKKQREIAKKGGKASVKAKAERKRIREQILDTLEACPEIQGEMVAALLSKARKGHTQSIKLVATLIGEMQPQMIVKDNPLVTSEEAKQALIDLGLVSTLNE